MHGHLKLGQKYLPIQYSPSSNGPESNWVHFQGKQICQIHFRLPCQWGSTLKRKEFAPIGANSFLFESILF